MCGGILLWKGDLVVIAIEMRERERERLDVYTVCVWYVVDFFFLFFPPPAQQSLSIRAIIERNGQKEGRKEWK